MILVLFWRSPPPIRHSWDGVVVATVTHHFLSANYALWPQRLSWTIKNFSTSLRCFSSSTVNSVRVTRRSHSIRLWGLVGPSGTGTPQTGSWGISQNPDRNPVKHLCCDLKASVQPDGAWEDLQRTSEHPHLQGCKVLVWRPQRTWGFLLPPETFLILFFWSSERFWRLSARLVVEP